MNHRRVVTKLWVNGRASEDRDEWTEEVRDHCERCYDDKAEIPEVQAERIRRQKDSGDRQPLVSRNVRYRSHWREFSVIGRRG